jgi:hypothetical protein
VEAIVITTITSQILINNLEFNILFYLQWLLILELQALLNAIIILFDPTFIYFKLFPTWELRSPPVFSITSFHITNLLFFIKSANW